MTWLLFLLGCLPKVDPGDEADTDTDTDSDADVDTDVDADSDADADVDGALLDVAPTLDFGSVPAGCDVTRPLALSNLGDEALAITSITAGGPFSIVGSGNLAIPAMGSDQVEVRFAPVGQSDYDAMLTIESNSVAGDAQVALAGQGSVPGLVEDVFVQTSTPTSDVLLVVDNSCSMTEEQGLLNNNVGNLLLELDNLGSDYQIAVITTDLDNPAEQGRFVGPIITSATPNRLAVLQDQIGQGVNGSGNERPLDAVGLALSPALLGADNAGFKRAGAQLTVIVLSDEDDQASIITPSDFVTEFEALQGDPELTTFTGITGPPGGLFPCINGGISADPAPTLFEVALGTGGGLLDICASSWASHTLSLAHVSTGHRVLFELSGTPVDVGSLEVRVDGSLAPMDGANGWTWLGGTQILLMGSWIPADGAELRVTYSTSGPACP